MAWNSDNPAPSPSDDFGPEIFDAAIRDLSGPTFEVVRELTEEDLKALAERPRVNAPQSATVVKLKNSHHRIAQLLALGQDQTTVAALTGYNSAYISQLLTNVAFQALVQHYAGIEVVAHADALDRLRALGIDAIEELQARVAEAPEEISTGELREIVNMSVVKPFAAAVKAQGEVAAAKAAPRTFQVVFRPGGSAAPLIEGERGGE